MSVVLSLVVVLPLLVVAILCLVSAINRPTRREVRTRLERAIENRSYQLGTDWK